MGCQGDFNLGTIARQNRYSNAKIDRFVQEALFTTITTPYLTMERSSQKSMKDRSQG
jgi:hypothetical protein